MNDKQLHELFTELSRPKADVPLFGQKLRAALIAQHAPKQSFSRRILGAFIKQKVTKGKNIMNKKLVTFGLSALAVGAFAFAMVTLVPHQPASAGQLIEGASKSAQQMSPAEIQAINAQYKQDLATRLNEAKGNPGLRILQEAELGDWGIVKAKSEFKTYLGYRDASNHRIVIGLDKDGEPGMVYDVDAAAAAPNANTPSMQVN